MAGHSKWANIKHRKAAADAKKGKVFTRLIKEITVAAKMGGGGDPDMNPRLRLAMDKNREANMTKDSVQNAIKRGTGQLEGVSYDEARYEGYGPGGAAVLVDCLTDNRTRTVAEVRHAARIFQPGPARPRAFHLGRGVQHRRGAPPPHPRRVRARPRRARFRAHPDR